MRLDDDVETEEAVNLYQWAIQCVRDKTYTPWPEGAPRPTRTPVHGSGLHVANEVFLTAVAWMLLHEAGHLARNHPFLTSSRSLDEEHEADFFATDQTRPPVEERIGRNLRGPELESNDRVHAFATALIQFHLGVVGIFPQLNERAQFGEFVDDFCLSINRLRKSA